MIFSSILLCLGLIIFWFIFARFFQIRAQLHAVKKYNPRHVNPHEKEQHHRKRAVDAEVGFVICGIKDEDIFTQIPDERGYK